jgi:hypothetical protein
MWGGVLPIIGVVIWLFLKYRKTKMNLCILSVFSTISGLFLSFIWPLIVWLNPQEYVSIDLLSNINIWDIVLSYATVRSFSPSDFNLLERLLRVYWNTGHLTFQYLFSGLNLIYTFIIIIGLIFMLDRIKKIKISNLMKDKVPSAYLFWFIWLFSYLPVHLGKYPLLQHLVILTPVLSSFIGVGIIKIYNLLTNNLNKFLARCFMIIIILFFLISPIRMILTGNEILYRTYYKEMGEYVKPRITDYNYSAICRYIPGFTYYADKPCISTDSSIKLGLKKPISWYVENKKVRFVEIKTFPRDNPLKEKDIEWVINNCKNVDKEAGIPKESYHHLYDCLK